MTADVSPGIDGDVDGAAGRGDAGTAASGVGGQAGVGNTGTAASGVGGAAGAGNTDANLDVPDGGSGDGPGDGTSSPDGDANPGDDATRSDGTDAPTAPALACAITGPHLSVTHPMLNGVPTAQGGDRVNADGAPYQVAFEVTTSLTDNQTVVLTVDDVASPTQTTVYTAQVSNGRARFPGVTLPIDGVYEAQARCLGKDGLVGLSPKETFAVDTTPPELTVSDPHSGELIPPSGLTDGTFPVCGGTTSEDAVNLDPGLGPRSANGCVAAGGTPTCFPIPSTQAAGCLPVRCPGDAPFDVVVTLGDTAGNVTRLVISNVSCFSTLPSVQIVSPISDAPPFRDPSKHLLAATQPQNFRDNAGAAGAQTDVVACANRAGTIALFVGYKGDATLVPVGAPKGTRVAVAADLCPSGFLFAVTFTGVTLPESTEAADTSLVAPTELRADLVDLSTAKNSSPVVDLWVDSVEPVMLVTEPVDICNSYHQSNDVYLSTETVTSTAPNVDLTLTNSSSTQNFSSSSFTTLIFPFVVFTQGQTTLAGTARDDAGNVSLMQPNPCVVTVGTAPP
jgi:hypothetical protein